MGGSDKLKAVKAAGVDISSYVILDFAEIVRELFNKEFKKCSHPDAEQIFKKMIEKVKKEKKNAVNHGSGLAKDRVFKLAMELKKDGVETKVVGVSMPAEGETAEKTA